MSRGAVAFSVAFSVTVAFAGVTVTSTFSDTAFSVSVTVFVSV
jgi:hypothetical protein